ncbi:hypothetical protein [Sphingomonas sp. Leaf198]|uniref:hypothetical protein n=1 Tax=Sphingomonas sp. Leaf198 TaxID=1736299 RepID=UPI00191C094B|nr:hypothetical protein [Sphingomonas sp. Leaf198]
MTLTKLLAGISPVALMMGTGALAHAKPVLAEAALASAADKPTATAPADDPEGRTRRSPSPRRAPKRRSKTFPRPYR